MSRKEESSIHKTILEFLKDAPRGLSTTQITQLLNERGIQISRVSVRKYLLELFGQGLVQRDKIGVARVWYLTPEDERGRPLISPEEWEIIDQILNFLDFQDHPRSIQEIADSLQINRNTIANILRVMEQLGLVEEHGQGRNSLWRIRVEPADLKQAFSRIAVVLVECNCQLLDDMQQKESKKSSSSQHGDRTLRQKTMVSIKVLSMNSTARELAHLTENMPPDLTLQDLEIQMFQRPLMNVFLTRQIEKAITLERGNLITIRDKLPKTIDIPDVYPRLERDRNTYWKISTQIEEPTNGEDDEPPRFLITYQDVTAKFQLKHLIWRSSRAFQEFFMGLSVPVALISPDFKVIEGNNEFQQLIGATERFWGYHCFSLFRGRSRQCSDCPILTGGLPRDIVSESSLIHGDGEEIIYFPGEHAPRKFKMRIIVNANQMNNQVTSYFLVLQPL